MSKKFHKNQNKKQWNNGNFSEHDNRDEQLRRVHFKHGTRYMPNKPNHQGGGNERRGGKKQQKNWEHVIKSHLEDEDIDMGSQSQGGRFHAVKNRKGGSFNRVNSPAPRGHAGTSGPPMRPKLLEGPTNWYKVTLKQGANYDKEYCLKALLGHVAPETFIPINWKTEGTDYLFYLDDFKLASKISNADRKITLPDNRKLVLRVHYAIPQVVLNAEVKEKMKLAMAKRYNPTTKALDLTKFHINHDVQDVFCALFRAPIMNAAIDIIAENIPELQALSLCHNRLYIIEHLSVLKKKLPHLNVLHIGNNNIRDIKFLDYLKGLDLIELVLDGNPLCDKFEDQSVYVSEVRKRFPKVIKLDGVDLPPPIVFDLGTEDAKLPTSHSTFLCNEGGKEIVRSFLEQYFQIYDSGNRQSLLQAYHENAMYSMTMGYPVGSSQKNSPPLNWYQSDSRNLFRVLDIDRRNKLLRQGQLSIISFLSEIPKSQHDMNSFKVDLSFFTPQFLMLNVSGIFKEIGSGFKTPPIRAFNRVFIIVAANSGFCIINEQIYISNATEDQMKDGFKVQIESPKPIVPVQSPPPVQAIQAVLPEPDDGTKQQMVHALAQQTGMNIDFSTKCLQETSWDYQRAVLTFTELHKQNRIPPGAFV